MGLPLKRRQGPQTRHSRTAASTRGTLGRCRTRSAEMSIRAAVIDTVTILVASDYATTGFKKLAHIGRLDPTFEVFYSSSTTQQSLHARSGGLAGLSSPTVHHRRQGIEGLLAALSEQFFGPSLLW